MKTNSQRGFTLIELLVVIAIIGMLAAVVLASLNTARAKGADASIKSTINNGRAQAEIYYDSQTPNSYASVCTVATGGLTANLASVNTTNGTGAADCNSSGTAWAMAAQLVATPTQYYCVDSTGVAETNTGTVGGTGAGDFLAAATVCP